MSNKKKYVETELSEKRKKRVKQTAEIFTPEPLVNQMLDKLSEYAEDIFKNPEKTFIDPAAGNGNFLINVLQRKLKNGISPLKAIKTIFGVELMEDNVNECKDRLLGVIIDKLNENELNEAKKILNTNIVCHDALTYDFSFEEKGV